MKSIRPITACAAVAVALGATASPADAAPVRLATEPAPFTAAAYGGYSAWSHYSDQEGGYKLDVRAPDGTVVEVTSAPQGYAYDVSLGPGPDGKPVAVYSLCKGADGKPAVLPEGASPVGPRPATGCDLYQLSLPLLVETEIEASSSPTRSESFPSIDGDKVAFARAGATASDPQNLYIGNVAGAPGSVRQPTGPRTRNAGVRGTSLAGGRLVYAWHDTIGDEQGRDTLRRVLRTSSVAMYVTRSGSANLSRVIGPTYDAAAHRIYFGETDNAEGGNLLYRTTLGGRDPAEVAGSPDFVSAAWTGDRFLTASTLNGTTLCSDGAGDVSHCTLDLQDPPAWTAVADPQAAGFLG